MKLSSSQPWYKQIVFYILQIICFFCENIGDAFMWVFNRIGIVLDKIADWCFYKEGGEK